MRYERISKGRFLSRPNRFIAHVELGGEVVVTHVKNTGRCRELLVPGATVYLEKSDRPARKTLYDLVAVEKGRRLINMDAQAPNKVFGEWATAGHFVPALTLLRPENTWGNSRFDFYWEAGGAEAPTSATDGQTADISGRRGFVEVKGVTLEEGGAVYFPDAPTQRGLKHVEELIACRKAGYEATLFLVVQMEGVSFWSPNDRTHPAFGEAVRRAAGAGVKILAYDCRVEPESLELREPVPIRL